LKVNIVAIVGSPRANSNTAYLTDLALEEASKLGVGSEKFVLTQYRINPCLGHDECRQWTSCYFSDDVELIVPKLYEADGIILASPVYYYNVTSQMKAFIDRNVFYRRHGWRLKEKCAGVIVIATRAGLQAAADALTRFIKLSGSGSINEVMQVDGFAEMAGEIASNAPVVEEARKLGRKMAEALMR